MIRIFKIIAAFLFLQQINLSGQVSGERSVLSSGKWFRIAVTEEGIYRIDYSRLKQLGLDNPSYPKIYGNNAGQLSYYNNGSGQDDLKELPLYIQGDDSGLKDGEYILFYAEGTGKWVYNYATGEYSHLHHDYSDTAFYFITSGAAPGKKVMTAEIPSSPAGYFSSQSDALFIHEKDEVNLIKSGREWFQRISEVTIDPGFSDIIVSEKVKYDMRVAARASGPTLFRLTEGALPGKTVQVPPVNLYDVNGKYAEITDSTGSMEVASTSPVYDVKFVNPGEPGAYGWLDYLILRARRSNIFTGKSTRLLDSRSVAAGRITEFSVTSSVSDPVIWDVSDPYNVTDIPYVRSGDQNKFKARSDSLLKFIVFSPDRTLNPSISPVSVPNQDLRSSLSCDMIIITHPLFRSYAERLAGIHFDDNGLISQVVTPEQIYNEFSGGIPDICAIRNYIRMKYLKQKETQHPLKYVLLFGDGSYENKTPPPLNPNFIPTYQSQNSNVAISSFTSDDFYVLLEDGEGEALGTEDVGIGRLPVSDTVQAGIMISKILRYLDPHNMGEWKNVISLTADDEDGNSHMTEAEGLATLLKDSVPSINVEKIYLDAFRQVTNANGQSYPDVNKAINDRINSGCLIFNYTGHGNENGLAHERVVTTEDINSWKNYGKLPLFITATCEFSRFDDMDINIVSHKMTGKTSAGEMVLLNNEGGGIALMSTTRLVYSEPNYELNRNILDCAFRRDRQGNTLTLGEIMKTAKNRSGSGNNKRNFTLLGDPALKLAFPWHGNVMTDSINGVSVNNKTDSLKALSVITIAGHVEDPAGRLMQNFNGVVSPVIYDKAGKIRTLANDGGSIMEFELWNKILFSGKTMAENGNFRFTFIVPRDIDYAFGRGRISYYTSDESADMSGCFSGIITGGFSDPGVTDIAGPDIRLYLNDTLFRSGGITGSDPRLYAIIEDKSGINTSGSAIGHDLTAFLDNDRTDPILLNSYFENDFDNYMKGSISYDLQEIGSGSHSLTLRAWDNYNNSSEKTIVFIVEPEGKFILSNLINYPNPFTGDTWISAGHNRPGEELYITVNIYSLDGRIIRVIKTTVAASGYVIPPLVWDGTCEGGKRAGRGIYPYSVTVTTGKGETAKATGRMIIL
jgi:Peptidase family C25